MRADRTWMVGLGLCAAALLAFVIYQFDPRAAWFPECLFHHLTGLACPGCGMTRALHAALHGRWGEAFRFNPLGMVMLPAWLVYMGFQMPAWLRPGPRPLRIRIAPCGVWWILGLVLGYWVLRNLPVWPYVLPAPP